MGNGCWNCFWHDIINGTYWCDKYDTYTKGADICPYHKPM